MLGGSWLTGQLTSRYYNSKVRDEEDSSSNFARVKVSLNAVVKLIYL